MYISYDSPTDEANMKRRMRVKKCDLCGKTADSKEHVPPKGMFPEPRPSDLITVPSCEAHNKEYSMDDEYFIWFITTASAYSSSAMKVVDSKIVKAFKRKSAYHRRIMSQLTDVEMVSDVGLYLTTTKAFKYEVGRVHRIIDKIVRALCYHENKKNEVFPSNYQVRKFYFNPPLNEDLTQAIADAPGKMVANGDFWYKYRFAIEDHYLMMWFLMFFGGTLILALTDRRDEPKWKL
jgi:hypothetical protein